MKKSLVIAAAAGVYALWSLWGVYQVSAPLIRKSGAAVVVGTDHGDHALFSMSPGHEISACNIGYQYNSFGVGGGDLRKIGGRALIAYLDSGTYAQIAAARCSTGRCMASYLNEKERQGAIGHLLLIPDSPAAMIQMEQLTLSDGAKFLLRGRDLKLEDGTLGGAHFRGKIRGLGYFLVESIRPD